MFQFLNFNQLKLKSPHVPGGYATGLTQFQSIGFTWRLKADRPGFQGRDLPPTTWVILGKVAGVSATSHVKQRQEWFLFQRGVGGLRQGWRGI